LKLHSLFTTKPQVFRVRDWKGGEAGTSWNERRDDYSVLECVVLSKVQRSTGAKRTPEKPDGELASRNAQKKTKDEGQKKNEKYLSLVT
jgi:hypothetical protein